MFLLNSRLGLFTAAYLRRHPFSQSYGVILPSSLARVLSSALGFSPRLPVSVCGTGTLYLARGFSWQCGIRDFGTYSFPRHHSLAFSNERICLLFSLPAWTHNPVVRYSYPPASPHCSNGIEVVQEFQPVVHRLRLSAST